MQTVSTIGLDIAKSDFQVHGLDANGLVVIEGLAALIGRLVTHPSAQSRERHNCRVTSFWRVGSQLRVPLTSD